jgi:hypothetical protein
MTAPLFVVFRAPSGRLHSLKGCTGGAGTKRMRKWSMSATKLAGWPDDQLCRCAWHKRDKARATVAGAFDR